MLLMWSENTAVNSFLPVDDVLSSAGETSWEAPGVVPDDRRDPGALCQRVSVDKLKCENNRRYYRIIPFITARSMLIFAFHMIPRSWHDDVIKCKHFPRYSGPLWRHPLVTGGFLSQRPVARSFDVFFDLRLNKGLSKQSKGRWFETPWRLLSRHYNGNAAGCGDPLYG